MSTFPAIFFLTIINRVSLKGSYQVYFETILNTCNFHFSEDQEFATPDNYKVLDQTRSFILDDDKLAQNLQAFTSKREK